MYLKKLCMAFYTYLLLNAIQDVNIFPDRNCLILNLLGLCLLADASFWAVWSFSFELPPAESFLSLSVPVFFRPVDSPEVTGAGLGATDDDAVEADGGLDPRSRFTGDLVRAVEREEAPLDDLPVVEGTRSDFEKK